MKLLELQLKDLVLIALTVSAVFVLGYILIPVMQFMPLPAYKAIIVSPIYAGGVTFLTKKIPKIGIPSLLGLLIGVLLSGFFIGMFFIAFFGGILTDLFSFLVFRGYKSKRSIILSSAFFPAVQLPLTFYMAAYTIGGVSGEALSHPVLVIVPTILTFVLGYLASVGTFRLLERRNL
ncbi:hypothetical protein [Isachenkonia alkalipeptolytica]|uniref:Uncharacterized protein n=1 Tax=Isachenkonia alkalipeptolytica TaxID=2565777 RepID=A0AA43XHI0_9CLOT|nr:hypothetical protein [Isachenkonia alkalipeptolytica]NBG86957.1 hypothetical protein [Isachenkonia alkalipeptolytica]